MASIVQSAWHQIATELRKREPALTRTWLLDLDAPILSHGTMTILARNEAQLRHMTKCREALAKCAQHVLGRLVTVDLALSELPVDSHQSPDESTFLRADHTLANFVVAPENRLAHAATAAMVKPTDLTPSVLYLHGPPGAGKSHLLQALCSERILADGPGLARYATALQFIAEFTEASESGFAAVFRRQFTDVSLVAIDDLQDFEGRSRSLEELFHVINILLSSGRQVVFAADRTPRNLDGFEQRLVSRLEGGLVMAVDAPGLDTRIAILKQKNEAESFEIAPEVLRLVAERCPAAELDTVLSRLGAMVPVPGSAITADLVDELFRGGSPSGNCLTAFGAESKMVHTRESGC